MDRTAWVVIVTCLLGLFGWQAYLDHQYPVKLKPRVTATNTLSAPVNNTTKTAPETPTLQAGPTSPVVTPVTGVEETQVLENAFVRATLTSLGGGLKQIELKQHRAEGERLVTLNEGALEPVLNISGVESGLAVAPYALSREGEVVIARRTWANGVVLERRFQLAKDHDYVFQVEQTLKNPTPQGVVWPAYQVNVGTAQPLHVHDQTLYIKSGWLEAANEHFHVTTLHDFEPGGFFFGMFGAHAPRTTIAGEQTGLQWVSVKNQFFTLILTPLGQPLLEKVESHKVALARQNRLAPFGLQAVAGLPAETLAAGAEVKQNFQLYAGPKEYARLKGLPHREDVVMEFGFWSWVVKPLLATLNQLHRWVPNYGWVIILLTLGIKMTLWPLQGIANRNMKQMQALAPKMKELQERHKDAPEKLNKDMMKLYQEYGVNPMGGCLPMLIQMPIFLGFYTMLQSAVELRNASFFWIHDLSQPDTIAHLPLLGSTLDINPLPLIMSATTMLLMRMSPQSSDNPQMKMMQWMPLIFVFFLYNFASALSLYWTVNNLISIGQTYYNLRQPLPVLKKVAKK